MLAAKTFLTPAVMELSWIGKESNKIKWGLTKSAPRLQKAYSIFGFFILSGVKYQPGSYEDNN